MSREGKSRCRRESVVCAVRGRGEESEPGGGAGIVDRIAVRHRQREVGRAAYGTPIHIIHLPMAALHEVGRSEADRGLFATFVDGRASYELLSLLAQCEQFSHSIRNKCVVPGSEEATTKDATPDSACPVGAEIGAAAEHAVL